jgi:hypothetical protein
MGITMLVLAVILGNADITSSNYSMFLESSQISFGIFTALSFMGAFLSLLKN